MSTCVKPDGVFEPVPGLYSQVVVHRSRTTYEIAGTLPYEPDGSLPEAMADQARVVMENIDRSLASVGRTAADVVRINIFTSDLSTFMKEAMEVVFGHFGERRPASTLVEISRLCNPDVHVEIEAVAVDDDDE